jgi:tight adherence protein B
VTTAVPYAIFLGISAFIGLVAFSLSGSLTGWLEGFGKSFEDGIARADVKVKPQDYVLIMLGGGALLWILLAIAVHTTLLIGMLLLPLSLAVALIFGSYYLKFAGTRRVNAFTQQLELVLRQMSGALRVGLGLRQSIILVTEEIPDPARREFMRVIGRTNIGVSILEALDEMSTTMPSQEMNMMAKSIRIQATTGGDLAKVLESLADTIRDRRRIQRKMSALTAQGRGSAVIIGALPLLVGGFVLITQPEMSHALLHTRPGWIALGIVAVLEGLAGFFLSKILQFDV